MTSLPEPYAVQIESLATQLAEAVADAGAARRVVEEAEALREQIAGRITALAQERESIITRRGEGEKGAGDGAALALIMADMEGLQPMLVEAAQMVQETQRVHSEHAGRASSIRVQIAHTEALAARDALVGHADALSLKLYETINALDAACLATGHTGRPLWGAPPALFKELRKFAAARGEL